ncbi:MAG: hypothetical protein Q4B76_00540 [bacterium]|nr:hypothetical protein [bacterium]
MAEKVEQGNSGNNPENGQDWAEMAKQAIDERTRQEFDGQYEEITDDMSEDEKDFQRLKHELYVAQETTDMPGKDWEKAAQISGLEQWREHLSTLRGYLQFEQDFDERIAGIDDVRNGEHRQKADDYDLAARSEALEEMRKFVKRNQGESQSEYRDRLLAEAEKGSSVISFAELAKRVQDKSEDGLYARLVNNSANARREGETNEDFAARISYLAEMARRRAENPNERGEDDSAWRARIGLSDMPNWLKEQEARANTKKFIEEARAGASSEREKLDEATREAMAKVYGDEVLEEGADTTAIREKKLHDMLHEMMPKMMGETADSYEQRLVNALAQVRSASELTFAADDIRNSEGAKRKKYNAMRKITEANPQLEGESLQQYRDRLLYLAIEGGVDLAAIDEAESTTQADVDPSIGTEVDDGNNNSDAERQSSNDEEEPDDDAENNPDGGAEDDSDDAESEPDDPERLKQARDAVKERAKTDKDFGDYLELLGITDEAIDSMSISDVNDLFEGFENRDSEEGQKRTKEIVLADLDNLLKDEKFKKWLEAQGINADELRDKDPKEIRDILNRYNSENSSESNEDKESDAEKLKELRDRITKLAADDPDFEEFLKEKGIDSYDYTKLGAEKLQELLDGYTAEKEKNDAEKLKELRDRITKLAADDPDFEEFLKEKGIVSYDYTKLGAEKLQELLDEYAKRQGKESSLPEMKNIAVAELDVERDVRDAIRAEADRMHTEYLQGIEGYDENGRPIIRAGRARRFVRRMIFGSMFKEANIVHYERQVREEFENGTRKLDQSGIERFTMAYAHEAEDVLIHEHAGEDYNAYSVKVDEDGNEYVERRFLGENGQIETERVDDDSEVAQNTIDLRNAIRDFAAGSIDERTLRARIDDIRRDENGEINRAYSIDNYVEAAIAARENIEHGYAMENVMEGFAYINGEARRNVRTQEHRDNLDRITHALLSNRVTRFIPPEAIAVGVGAVANIGKFGASAAARAGFALGGVAVSGAMAGMKERARVTRERSVAQRRLAQGGELGDTKFDRQLGETIQGMASAEDLTANLNSAMEAFNNENASEEERNRALNLLRAQLGGVEALVTISDRDGIDMIRYTNGDNETIENQRLRMDIARAEARSLLLENGVTQEELARTREYLERDTYESEEDGLNAREAAFRSLRRRRALKRAAATAAIGVATTLGTQELNAAFNDDVHGIWDHLTRHQDNDGATQTLLAHAFGMEQSATTVETAISQGVDEATAAQYRNQEGFTVKEAGTRTVTENGQISQSEYLEQHGESLHRNWFNNNTEAYDGNELGIHTSESGGFITSMSGASTRGGESLSFGGGEGIKGYLTLNSGQAPIEVAGKVVNGQVDFSEGLNALGLGDIGRTGAYKFFEVAKVAGENADGSLDINVLATSVGNGFGDGMIGSTISREVPIFDVIQTVTHAGTSGVQIPGFVTIPFSRRGITFGGRGRKFEPTEPRFGGGGNENPPSDGDGSGSPERPTPTGDSDGDGDGDGSSSHEGPAPSDNGEGTTEDRKPFFRTETRPAGVDVGTREHYPLVFAPADAEQTQRADADALVAKRNSILDAKAKVERVAGIRADSSVAEISVDADALATSSETLPELVMYRPDYTVFEKSNMLTSANGERSLSEIVSSVNREDLDRYVFEYFSNGILTHEHANKLADEFMMAVSAWDNFPAEKRQAVLKGGDADTILGKGWGYWTNQFEFMGLMEIDDEDVTDNPEASATSSSTSEPRSAESGSEQNENITAKGDFYKYMGLSGPITKDEADLNLQYRQGTTGNWSNRGLDEAVHQYAYDNGEKDKDARIQYGVQLRRGIREWSGMTDEQRRDVLSGKVAASEDIQFMEKIGLIQIG